MVVPVVFLYNRLMNQQNPFGEKYQKYWDRLPQNFSKFNEGIQIDLEGLFSVGPEEISKKIARRTGAKTVVDGFCGVGGSTIGYAHYAEHIYAIDNNIERLKMAKHNIDIYGFLNKVEFIFGDFLIEAPKLKGKAEAVFIDPPWGGPDYSNLEVFTLENFSPHGATILNVAFENYPKVVLRAPKNFNVESLNFFGKKFVVDNEMFGDNIAFRTIYFFEPKQE